MGELISILNETLESIGFLPLAFIAYILGMYIFWAESRAVNKNRSSIFDQWMISTFFMILWGRVSYILAEWHDFALLHWFYSPYERYGDKVFWFRLLPWKFLAFWDGGFLFTGLILGFLLFNFIYVTFIKKWRWRDMFRPTIISSQLLLSVILSIYGIFLKDTVIVMYGLVLLVLVTVFYLLKFLKKFNKDLLEILFYVELFYTIGSFLYIGVVFWSGDITVWDKVNIFGIIFLSIFLVYVYYRDVKNINDKVVIESVSGSVNRKPSVETNKAIKVVKTEDK